MISRLQAEHKEWLEHNFPNQQGHDPLLGIMEEVGELSHAYLKNTQGIRGMVHIAEARTLMADALGDIFIYMLSFSNTNGFNLENCINKAWLTVKERDWVHYPVDGRTT
jgi:NTP pyrophosphatase (non-canonical NTP hydrolase)